MRVSQVVPRLGIQLLVPLWDGSSLKDEPLDPETRAVTL